MTAAAIIGSLAAHRVSLDPLPFVATQAFAIRLLIGIGVQKAVKYHTPGPPAILIGIIATTFGGTVVDLIARSRVTIMSEGPWYLSVIFVAAVIFWLLTIYVAFYPAVAVTVIVVTGLRVLSVRFGWASPVFPGDDLHSADR